ncbi:MAG: acetylxylan esterase [Chthonomonadales bacterium]
MIRNIKITAAILIGMSLRISAGADTPVQFQYDSKLPLNAELRDLPDVLPAQAALRKRWKLTYSSTNNERVTAIFALPAKGTAPFPAVLLLAGSGGHKDTDYVRYTADMLSTLGCATISIDAQYHGDRSKPGISGDIHLVGDPVMRDAFIQTVVDLRRAVDYFCSRKEIDATRIGYMGFSQGGIIGGSFVGVELRVKATILAVAGGGMIAEGKNRNLYTDATAEQFAAAAKLTDPMYFIGGYAGRPLLMLSAKKDELIPKAMTDALFNAAKEPKKIVWFNSGHALTPTALLVNVKTFFQKQLKLTAS